MAARGVAVVLAQDRDRFARELAYHYHLRRELEERGTKIRALNDRGEPSGASEKRFRTSSTDWKGNCSVPAMARGPLRIRCIAS